MIKLLSKRDKDMARVLFLGYKRRETKLIACLINDGHEVWHTDKNIDNTEDFDIAISFGYTHILKGNAIHNPKCPIVNLHISYLPYNRGAYPNFWSFYDGTPSGVTIHLVDDGIDTGNIIFQKLVQFDLGEKNFSDTYDQLKTEVESLFIENRNTIVSKSFISYPQDGIGTFHRENDLPKDFSGWSAEIQSEIIKLKNSKIRSDEQD